jgi:hypothetical protein
MVFFEMGRNRVMEFSIILIFKKLNISSSHLRKKYPPTIKKKMSLSLEFMRVNGSVIREKD